MLQNYLPVIMQTCVALGFCAIMLGMSVLLGQKGQKNATKDSAYECGMLPVGDGAPRMSIKFYVLAMLFVIFDIEVVFLYPWAVQFRELTAESAMAFWSICGFVGILGVAYIYALKKGALSWGD
ncbi:NADH-quinone oxidoreductase subunit A [Verrucomicrobiaceae bacterium N1E253]|uniref:NADH-quinone oxidoreductase subunit A n=1 Tax=Oceaniferula marina TaxID=2748318 RepID=A0A851GD34_9BACT|nr:NADH-quinone oxidoreductase subunit A [Oceaniferula marina]NWK55668.1 NADH-quinone oxidoreductase subunit A [Oceaniferula marina]